MTPENFSYWLKGFFELSNTDDITKEQVLMIKEHLSLVFEQKTKNPYDILKDPGTFKDHSGITEVKPDWTYMPKITSCTRDHSLGFKQTGDIVLQSTKCTISC